jgi:heme/copper-type cytochrome/quinol oxidase subunit 4
MGQGTQPAPRRELRRDAVEMALYVALSLLAVEVALPRDMEEHETVSVAVTLAITAVGLLAAHWLAFRVSARLESGGLMNREQLSILGAQLAGSAIVVGLTVVPILVLPPPTGLFASQLTLLAVIAGVAYAAARPTASRARSTMYSASVVFGTAIVVAIKDAGLH